MKKSKMSNHDALHKAFMKVLLKSPVTRIRFFGNNISLTFFNQRIRNNIARKPENHVADWSRKRKQVVVDTHINQIDMKKSFKALSVHEAIEKFLVEKFGLKTDTEAHSIATQKEKEYLKRIGGNWKSHQQIVYREWSRHGKH